MHIHTYTHHCLAVLTSLNMIKALPEEGESVHISYMARLMHVHTYIYTYIYTHMIVWQC